MRLQTGNELGDLKPYALEICLPSGDEIWPKGRKSGDSPRHLLTLQRLLDRMPGSSYLRLAYVSDDSADLSWLDQTDENMGRGFERTAKAERERASSDGCFGIVGQYRAHVAEPWETADSVWGFIGEDGLDTDAYLLNVMESTLKAYLEAKASICPHCGRPPVRGGS